MDLNSRARKKNSAKSDVILTPLDKDTDEYVQGWKHKKKQKPRLIRVLKISRPSISNDAYLRYQQKVQIESAFASKKYSNADGNECLLFHGTTRACLVGEDDKMELCPLSNCSLCRVIQHSYDIKLSGSNKNFSRFGKAIYTTACSSKADDYCVNTHSDAKYRCLLLNRVVAGQEFRTRLNSTHLVQPPAGYHSVVGEPGIHLKYEETVVYNNDAIRPAYLVLFDYKRVLTLKEILSTMFHSTLA